MSNLDNLIAKIIKDGDEKIHEILLEAEQSAAQIIDAGIAQGNKEKDEIINAAKAEASRNKEQIIMQKRIAVRDAKLRAKQEIFEKVLAMAAVKLKDMTQDEYKRFLTDYLASMKLDGTEELILPEKYNNLDLQEICTILNIAGLSRYQGDRAVSSGFTVLKGGMEYNSSFEALFDYYREDLEKIIADTLF